MARKVTVAVQSKRDPDFLIVARSDARGVEGLAATIDRGKRYVDAGADAIFPEGLETESEFKQFREEVSGPLLANMTEFGKTPLIPHKVFRDLGYQMVIFPMAAFRVMIKALEDAYQTLLVEGTQNSLIPHMKTRRELYDMIDYPSYTHMDESLQHGPLPG